MDPDDLDYRRIFEQTASPYLVMTADRHASLAAGFDAHLAKPLQAAELNRLLAAWALLGQPPTQHRQRLAEQP